MNGSPWRFIGASDRDVRRRRSFARHCQQTAEGRSSETPSKTARPPYEAFHRTFQAAYDGDPAAKSIDEVIFAYPAIVAITIFRIAHELHLQGIPLLPRIMTEHAHSISGIDIHPGATIGSGFFIDHGTGVVIGETTVIGDHVKLYSGCDSCEHAASQWDEEGQLIRGKKRHPNDRRQRRNLCRSDDPGRETPSIGQDL
jgi:hypothetical protein